MSSYKSDFFQPPSPGIQRWGCKCAQEFSNKRAKPRIARTDPNNFRPIACTNKLQNHGGHEYHMNITCVFWRCSQCPAKIQNMSIGRV